MKKYFLAVTIAMVVASTSFAGVESLNNSGGKGGGKHHSHKKAKKKKSGYFFSFQH